MRTIALLARAAMLAAAALPVAADELPALADGRPILQLRPRYTWLERADNPVRAEGLNLRTLVGWRSAPGRDFGFTAEVVNVAWLRTPPRANNDPFDRRSRYPFVGDPEKTDFNQLFVEYNGLADTRLRLGRQWIRLDNERFVSGVDAPQLPQVMDALTLRRAAFGNTDLFAGYVWRVRRFFGRSDAVDTLLLNGRTTFDSGLSLGAYAYLDDRPAFATRFGRFDNSNRIVGVRAEGNVEGGAGPGWYYAAEFAEQRPHADGNALVRARYHRLAAGPTWGDFSAQLSHERLGSNGGRYGFQMPLSYNDFQGWGYVFFVTPPQGIRDTALAVALDVGRFEVRLKRHRFRADAGGSTHAVEWDATIEARLDTSWTARLLLTAFDARSPAFVDIRRHYLTLQYDY